METNEEQVTRNIQSSRKRRGYSQEDIALKLNWTTRTIINLESKPFSYSIKKLNEYADAIGCNINEFFLPL